MKQVTIFFLSSILTVCVFGQKTDPKMMKPDPNKKIMVVEAACGECQFKLKGDDCELAVRIDGKSYFVDGTNIDSYGDAHAKDGFCKAVRKAEVQGELVNNRFKATYFKLLKPEEKNEAGIKQKN